MSTPIQSLADLGNSYEVVIRRTRLGYSTRLHFPVSEKLTILNPGM